MVGHKARYVPTGDLAVVDVINNDDWISAVSSLLLLSRRGLLVLPENVGESQTVQLPHSCQHWDWELVADVSEEVGQVGAQQDDPTGHVGVVLHREVRAGRLQASP